MASSNGEAAAGRRAQNRGSSFPRRFYTTVSVDRTDSGFALKLDARTAQTPGRNPVVLPNRAMAEAVALEWAGAVETIDPRVMPLTRLANTSIDGVARMQDEVLAEIVRFAGSDLLVYRATEPDELAHAQRTAWDPVIAWIRNRYGAAVVVTQGITHVAQPADTIERIDGGFRELVASDPNTPFRLAALHVITTLTGSALLAMAVAADRMNAEQAWSAAHLDEDYQISRWGQNSEAMSRRGARWAEFNNAVFGFKLTKPDD